MKAPSGVLLVVMALWCFCCCASTSSCPWPDSRAAAVLANYSSLTCGMVSGRSTTTTTCCHAEEDEVLHKEFLARGITEAACISIVKRLLCQKCFPSPECVTASATSPPSSSSTLHGHLTSAVISSSTSSSSSSPQQEAVACLVKIAAGTYNRMAPHPDGSSRMFLSTQEGEIWLASDDDRVRGSGSTLQMNDSPFLDLTDRELQLMGIAFHPEFVTNGRFFVSYTCNNSTMPNCASSCSSATGNGSMPTQYHLVVAEFSAKGGHDDYSKATHADPAEVRRVFSMALPLQYHTSSSYNYNQHLGQIQFGPIVNNDDGYYLYLVVGGGDRDLCKDNTSYCGKIIMFNVDNSSPSPKMEIFAVDLYNPMGCSFNSQRPSDFYCANVNQEQYEQVYLISNMTGTTYVGSATINISSLVVIDHGRSEATNGAPLIVGGIVYGGSVDPSLTGRYMYTYGSAVQQAAIVVTTPESTMPYATAPISTIWCSGTGSTPCSSSSSSAISGQVLFLGEDNNKDLIILTMDGLFRLVERSFCAAPPPPPQLSSQSSQMSLWKVLAGIMGVLTTIILSLLYCCYYCWNGAAAGGQALFQVINNNIQLVNIVNNGIIGPAHIEV